MLGFLSYPDVFFEFELGGTVFLFLGFILSSKCIARKNGTKAAEAKTSI
jgi:F0F1-type ATP synthase assembly protein I